ncbi:PREDICTED: protein MICRORCHIDIA 6-like [Ipomoea nil]|uniref:protein MICRORCHIDIA 6-like n=1 Tax=Ipomoea nil TaxID=35883 RepID=UPI00090099A4|nr:PREDICTED: protein MICRORCHIDIA 6-like [Ipomoea nil]XP_019182061.1 PREDICTED: protein MICRORCHIDIA 6-like [Ipomoea nil]
MNSKGNGSSKALTTSQNSTRILNQERCSIGGSSLTSSQICPAPLCRQFWKAGNYVDDFSSKPTHKNDTSYLRIHPKFLHSNATSHKWAFGAIAELVDNAVDEAPNGASFVNVDKCLNPRDGSVALLIQDDGGGMDPEAMRHCLSFGFSDKSKSAIGKYGNGFKTSTMRLGADVIVFSRAMRNRKLTQTIGLLSYSFLTQAGLDRIVVPMIDYEFKTSTGAWDSLSTEEKFMSNLSLMLQWSPYSTESDLLEQCDDIGNHGTKIIIYSLWLDDGGKTELDFDTDPEDIRVCGNAITEKCNRVSESDKHLANTLRFSLRAYLSILYLQVPEKFFILLRGRMIEYHNIATDLKYPEFILYRPQSGGCKEGSVVTTIGFLKEAPLVNHHGFNIYHKNRLILPFWQVVSYTINRGRGVVGVLEANFIQPTHNKQDFERTALFHKLEVRLKEMMWEYWDHHCGHLGYQPVRKTQSSISTQVPSEYHQPSPTYQPGLLVKNRSSVTGSKVSKQGSLTPTFKDNARQGAPPKRKVHDPPIEVIELENETVSSAGVISRASQTAEPVTSTTSYLEAQESSKKNNLIRENKKLHARCLEYGKSLEELDLKVVFLRKELKNAKSEYSGLLAESRLLENVEHGNNVLNKESVSNFMSMLSKYL